jgi:hypothetical protein
LAVDRTATDTFAYTIQNAAGAQDTATVTVTINGANDAPVAVDDSFQIGPNEGRTQFPVLLNDTDIDNGRRLVVLSVEPTKGTTGTVEVSANGGFIAHTPAADSQAAMDTFTYTVSDGLGGEDTATVIMSITGVGDQAAAQTDFMF